MYAIAFLPIFAALASAIQITQPSNTTGWNTKGSELIKWDSVDTDPSNFTIQLINPASPNSPQTLATEVKTSDHTYTYTPSSDLAAGGQWRVNFVSPQGGILAQSTYFDVTDGTSSVSASSSASSSSTVVSSSASTSGPSSSTSSMASQTSDASASSSSSAAATTFKSAATDLIAPSGLMLLITSAFALLA